MSDEPPKRSVGRPSDYRDEYCQMVIDHMAKGLSLESFAGVADVHKDTLYEWQKVHAEFSDAVKRGFGKCQLHWEKIGIEGIFSITESTAGVGSTSKSINATVWTFNMKNRFKWRDNLDVKSDETVRSTVTLSYGLPPQKPQVEEE